MVFCSLSTPTCPVNESRRRKVEKAKAFPVPASSAVAARLCSPQDLTLSKRAGKIWVAATTLDPPLPFA